MNGYKSQSDSRQRQEQAGERNWSVSSANTIPPGRELTPGEIIESRYKILSLVGRGGNGSVYKVEQIILRRQMALKTLNPVAFSDLTLMRFQKEGQAASRLSHPNLVRAIDFGTIEGSQPFLVMDFVEGEPLSDHLRRWGSLSVQEALDIFIPVCSGIAYAHQQGVVHRDLKPSNIILCKDDQGAVVPKVVDFGIAKLDIVGENTEVQNLTRTGEVFGTPLYMSPEQCAGVKTDNRTDIYSLGCVMFEALTGAPPFKGDTALSTMMQHTNNSSMSLKDASLGMSFPSALELIVAKMLAKEPANRYQTCEELVQHLTWLKQGEYELISEALLESDSAKPATKKKIKEESAALKKLITVSVIVFTFTAAAIGSCAYLYVQQSEKKFAASQSTLVPPALKASAQRQENSIALDTNVLPLMNQIPVNKDLAPYSKLIDNGRVRQFRFPTNAKLGSLTCWDTNHDSSCFDAIGTVSVPTASTVILTLGLGSLDPSFTAPLRTGDIQGLVLDCNMLGQILDDYLEKNTKNVEFRSLQCLWLKKTAFSYATMHNLCDLPNVRWLVLDSTNTPQSQIAAFKCLPNLRVFGLHQTGGVTDVLRKLAQRPILRRLMLARCGMSSEDWALLSQFKDLDTLDLMEVDEVAGKLPLPESEARHAWQNIGKLHNLKRIAFDMRDAGCKANAPTLPPMVISALLRLPRLRVVSFRHASAAQRATLQKYLPHTQLIDGPERHTIEAWTNPCAEDPTLADN